MMNGVGKIKNKWDSNKVPSIIVLVPREEGVDREPPP
jgi:hypothetical protein